MQGLPPHDAHSVILSWPEEMAFEVQPQVFDIGATFLYTTSEADHGKWLSL